MDSVKVISWEINLKKGEQVSLGYQYRVPPDSPQFYRVGSLKLYERITEQNQINNLDTIPLSLLIQPQHGQAGQQLITVVVYAQIIVRMRSVGRCSRYRNV